MISSLILIALVKFGIINTDKGLGFLTVYFIGLAVEVIIDIITLPKILDNIDKIRKRKGK